MKFLLQALKYKKYFEIVITLVKEIDKIMIDKKVTLAEIITLITKLGYVIVDIDQEPENKSLNIGLGK
jgi:hypothetical protein